MKDINRLKVVVSRWCSNVIQPPVDTFVRIAEALDVDVRELFNSTK
jgi:transcriptional regulator with XRE-family HTH domain